MKHYNLWDISLYQMQLFIALAEGKNFSRVAETLNLSQPALTKRISAIEDILGTPLFDRKKRPVELTKAGEICYASWSEITRQFEQSVEAIKKTCTVGVSYLRIGLIDSSRMIPAIRRAGRALERKNTDINIVWEYKSYNRWKESVLNNNVDVMLTLSLEKNNLDKQLEFEELVVCPKLVCMLKSNPLSKLQHITYEDLREQQFIINSPTAMASHYEFIREHTLKYGYEPQVARFTPSTHDLVGYLKGDNEVIVCDVFLRDIESEEIKIFELPDTYSGLIAVWRKNNHNPNIARFVETTKESLKLNPPIIPS